MHRQNKKHMELGGKLIEPFEPGKDTADDNVYSGTCSHPSSTRIEVTGRVMNSKEELKFIKKTYVKNKEKSTYLSQMVKIQRPFLFLNF